MKRLICIKMTIILILMLSSHNANAKKIKADNFLSVVKKILVEHKKGASLYNIGENIDLNISSTNLWDETTNDTIFMFIYYNWGNQVRIYTKENDYNFNDWHDKGIRTTIYSNENVVDYEYERIKVWDKRLFKSWRQWPKGAVEVSLDTVYRIIRKGKNRFEYSCFTYYGHTSLSDMIRTGPKTKIMDYYYINNSH